MNKLINYINERMKARTNEQMTEEINE